MNHSGQLGYTQSARRLPARRPQPLMTSFQRSSGRRCLVLGVWLLVVLWGSGAATPLQAQSQASDDPSPHSEATLVSEQDAIVPGEPLTVGLRLNMEEGWHSYWKNPGASGEPTSIDWALPSRSEKSGCH